jgi:hypothetical protein
MTAPIEEDILMNICPRCDLKYMCDNMPPHPYNNEIWHSCEHKNRIAKRLLSAEIKNNYSPEHRCDKCNTVTLVKYGRWVRDTGMWICYNCYPKIESYCKDDFY